MNWTLQQKIGLGFWLLTLAPIVLGALAAKDAYDLHQALENVAATNERIREIENLASRLKDIEVAQREFILTGSEQPLQAINQGHIEAEAQVRELARRKADRRWLSLLENLIPQKIEEIQQTIRLRHEAGPEAASHALLLNRGHQAMDDIRKVLRNMVLEEDRVLSNTRREQQESFEATMFLGAVMLALDVAFIWVLYFLQRREIQRTREVNEELERRVAERTEALQRSNEDLQQFAYVASHDMKEPLRMVSSYTTLLQRRYTGRLGEEADTFIEFIVGGVRRMDTLIEDLLEYSRAGAAKDEQLRDVNVAKVLKAVLENLKVTIADSGGRVTWEKLPVTVLYDEMRLTQIFQNLIGNAVKYRGERRPAVRITSREEGDEFIFSVSDNGIGIEPEYIDRIFGIFQRLHGKEYEGTGIGLAMVKRIVERYGGRIWVESTPGSGSTFYFSVLRTARTAAAEASRTTTT